MQLNEHSELDVLSAQNAYALSLSSPRASGQRSIPAALPLDSGGCVGAALQRGPIGSQ